MAFLWPLLLWEENKHWKTIGFFHTRSILPTLSIPWRQSLNLVPKTIWCIHGPLALDFETFTLYFDVLCHVKIYSINLKCEKIKLNFSPFLKSCQGIFNVLKASGRMTFSVRETVLNFGSHMQKIMQIHNLGLAQSLFEDVLFAF